MRKVFLLVLSILVCLCAVPALAEQDYSEVSGIPMAVDFSVRVEFDGRGMPQIVTDYPFEQTGATEMNVVYTIDGDEAVTLKYRHSTGTTEIGGRNPRLLGSDTLDAAYEAIRSGEAALGDLVYVGTSHFNQSVDWFLAWSRSAGSYVSYAERTFAQDFNAMGYGGVERLVEYASGKLVSSRVLKRAESADLLVYYNEYGEITHAFISVYHPQPADYHMDPATGLFGGRPITEFGFEEADLSIPAFVALDGKTTTSVAVRPAPPAEAGDSFSYTTAFGLLAGILMGLTLFYLFRRKKKPEAGPEPEKAEKTTGESAPAAPEETFDSAPKTFSSGK